MMRLFVSASLYPSCVFPQRGLFVEKRLLALKQALPAEAEINIYVPTPYFPFSHKIWGHYADYANMPINDERFGQKIHYLRYLHFPLIKHRLTVFMVQKALEKQLKTLIKKQKKPDILIAEYGFPDGLVLAFLGKKYNIPVIMTARGSDISYFPYLPTLKKAYQHAFDIFDHIVAVSNRMKQDVVALGYDQDKISVIGNGVAQDIFYHAPSLPDIRTDYAPQNQKIILCVGGLIPRKRHDLAIDAVACLKNVVLLIVGVGAEEQHLKIKIQSLALTDRVFLLGQKMHAELANLYRMADLFLLASSSEGRANVLLEAMACGCPVLSSDVGGSDEIITSDAVGMIFSHAKAEYLAEKINDMLAKNFDRSYISEQINPLTWEGTGMAYADVIEKTITHKKIIV